MFLRPSGQISRGTDAKEDSDTFRGIPAALAESEIALSDILPQTNCTRSLSGNGRVWRINDNAGKFYEGLLCETPGDAQRGIPSLNDQWIDIRYTQNNAQGERFALGASKNTDILRISPTDAPDGLNLNPFHEQSKGSVRASIISAAFLMQRIIADKLDIEPDEIEVASISRRILPDKSIVADMILSDRLPNSAGFVRWAYENLSAILTSACRGTDAFAAGLIEQNHRLLCDSACYDCLRVYRNMTYHGLLDWRLAISYLKVLFDPGYQSGLDGNFGPPELEGWLRTSETLRDNFVEYFSYLGYQRATWGSIPGFIAGPTRVILTHPLWDTVNPEGILADAVAAAGGQATYIDSFNLLRRPGWCHQQLGA